MSKKYLDVIRKRINESEQLKSAGELDQKDNKGVDLPKAPAQAEASVALKSQGELDQKSNKGVGLPVGEEANPFEKKDEDEKEVKEAVGAESAEKLEPKKAAETSVTKTDVKAPEVEGIAKVDLQQVSEEDEDAKEPADDEEEFDLDEEEEKDESKKEAEKKKEDAEIKEHVDALLNGVDLAEDFKEQIRTVFEAAVKSTRKADKQKVQEQAKKKLREMKKKLHEQLATDLDSYLDYCVGEWVNENKVPVEHVLRTQITEAFLGDLKALFSKHNIDLPEEHLPLVEEQKVEIENKTKQLNEQIEKNVQLLKEMKAVRKDKLILESCVGLTNVEADKFRALASDIAFEDEGDFSKKARILKESYFNKTKKTPAKVDVLVEEQTKGVITGLDEEEPAKKVDSSAMSQYVQAARRLGTEK